MSPQVDKEYVQTGKVRWTVRTVAWQGGGSQAAAEAAYCANEQGKYWEYHDLLFNKYQTAGGSSAFTAANLKQWAKDLGMNEAAFNSCVDSNKYSAQVTKDTQAAQTAGIQGTPTFLLNGRAVNLLDRDPQASINNFRKALDAELAK